MNLYDRLQAGARATALSRQEWRPCLWDMASAADREALEDVLRSRPGCTIHDRIQDQLAELVACREPAIRWTPADLAARVEAHLGGRPPQEYGRWVYYPWSGRLVHVLPCKEFRALRSDRNRDKILPEEQQRLRSARIGIAGLSVGQSCALTMALEGVGGCFRLADFDTLGLSNLNRLRARTDDLGINKAVLAARQMLELDPYLDVQVFSDGITQENLLDFLTAGGPLDLLVEECDNLYVKVRLREEARRLRIPVLMDTSDRGMIDVERFDREPDRTVLHGLLGSTRAADLKDLSAEQRMAVALKILDPSGLSARLRASLAKIKVTLETWPQLASAVALGGALATDVARRVLLGQLTVSGRFYVDVEAIIRDGAAVTVPR